jgi:AraC-like DNA-binding protein
MNPACLPTLPACPDLLARAARASGDDRGTWLRLAPPALQGALIALVGRDMGGRGLQSAQRLSHFPASPFVSISWFHGGTGGMMARDGNGPRWTPFGAPVMVCGTQSHPLTTRASDGGRGYIACFAADAARALFELDLAAIQDRFQPVDEAVGPQWRALWNDLLASAEVDLPGVLERHLAARWQALRGRAGPQPSLRQLGRHWVERLAWQARQWGRTHGARQVERRVKAFSGRSLRDWQALVRTEGLYFAARDRHVAGQDMDWAELAHAQGFADQSHMIRAARRITGFSPTEFAQRFAHDESFWFYRLWI